MPSPQPEAPSRVTEFRALVLSEWQGPHFLFTQARAFVGRTDEEAHVTGGKDCDTVARTSPGRLLPATAVTTTSSAGSANLPPLRRGTGASSWQIHMREPCHTVHASANLWDSRTLLPNPGGGSNRLHSYGGARIAQKMAYEGGRSRLHRHTTGETGLSTPCDSRARSWSSTARWRTSWRSTGGASPSPTSPR